MSQKRDLSVILSSAKMAIATAISRIFGLVREQSIAYLFGATGITDTYHVAYRIPNLLRELFAEGAFSAAFVPVFTEAKSEGHKAQQSLFSSAFSFLLIATGIMSLAIYLYAPEVVAVFAPSFPGNPEKYQLTITMVRILSPFLVFISIAALMMGVLNTQKVFFIPAVTPAFLNLSVIFCAFVVSPYFEKHWGHGIISLAVGILAGGLLQIVLQLPAFYKHGFRFALPQKLFTVRLLKIIKKLGPGLVGFALTQINLLINTILATGTVAGAVSWLSFGFRLFQLPVGILSVSLGSANLVHFSSLWKENKKEQAVGLLNSSYIQSLFIMCFPFIIAFVYADWLVKIVYQRGEFDATDTAMCALALKYYALALPVYGVHKLFTPVFYAIDKQVVPVVSSFFAIGLNIAFSLSFIDTVGFSVLAIASSLAIFLNVMIQGFFLSRYLSIRWNDFFNGKVLKVVLFTLASWAVAHWSKGWWNFHSFKLSDQVGALLVNTTLAGMTYLGLFILFGERRLVRVVLDKFKR